MGAEPQPQFSMDMPALLQPHPLALFPPEGQPHWQDAGLAALIQLHPLQMG